MHSFPRLSEFESMVGTDGQGRSSVLYLAMTWVPAARRLVP
jgi:hypothetical protein